MQQQKQKEIEENEKTSLSNQKETCLSKFFNILISIIFFCIFISFAVGILAGFSFLITYLLAPLNFNSTVINPISNLDHIQLNLKSKSFVEILDSSECQQNHDQNICLEETYTYSLSSENKFDFKYRIHINKEVLIKKFEISCQFEDQCEVNFESSNFRSENLYLYGYDMTINANQIRSDNIFFDSYLGNFKAENLIFEKASLNTSKGDIILQSQEHVSLTTITQEKYVCVTSKQYWKDNVSQIKNLSEVFEEKDEKKEECFFVHKYKNRDQQSMVQLGKHSVLDQLNVLDFTNSYEIRCNFINQLILMNDDSNPSSVTKFKEIKAGNSEGNIYVNILSNPNKLEKQVTNSYQQNSNVKLSQESQKDLNDTIRSILDLGQTNEIVYLDFRQSQDYTHNFVFVMIFNPIYLHISPTWLSALSFSSLSSADEQKVLYLKPGICPYIFKYSMIGDESKQEQLVSSNESIILDTINSFLESEDLSPYLILPWEDYNSISIRDQSTYPDVQNINRKVNIIISTEIICVIFLLGFIFVSRIYIGSALDEMVNDDDLKDLEKIVYFFLSRNLQNKKISYQYNLENSQNSQNESQSPKTDLQPIKENKLMDNSPTFKSNVQEELQMINIDENNSQSTLNKKNNIDEIDENKKNLFKKVKLGCEIQRQRSQNIETAFQSLSTRSFSWLQIKLSSSLSLFIKQLIRIQKFDINEQIKSQISYSELKQNYQLFCYVFNIQEECINDLIDLQHSCFELQYDQTIVFKKYDRNQKQNEGEFLVQLSQALRNQINDFISVHGIICGQMSLSLFYFLHANSMLVKHYKQHLNNNIVQQLQVNKQETNQIKNQVNENQLKTDQHNKIIDEQLEFNNVEQDNDLKIDELNKSNDGVSLTSYSCHELMCDNNSEDENQIDQDQFYIIGSKQKIFTKKNNKNSQYCDFLPPNIFYGIFFDETFLQGIQDLSGDFLESNKFQVNQKESYSSQKVLSEQQAEPNNCNIVECNKIFSSIEKSKIEKLKSKINSTYISSLFELPKIDKDLGVLQIIKFLKVSLRTLSLQALYIASPCIGCLLSIIFIILYINQEHMFNIDSYQSQNETNLFQEVFNFSNTGISLLAILCLVFIFFFYALLKEKNTFIFTQMTKNRFKGILQIVEKPKECKNGFYGSNRQTLRWDKIMSQNPFLRIFFFIIYFIKKLLVIIYDLSQICLQILQITYIAVAFLILIIGSIIFPRVQLPTLIFFGVLLGVVIQSIVTFNTQYDQGKQKLLDIFVRKFKNSAYIYQYNQKQKRKKDKLNIQEQPLDLLRDTKIYQDHEYKDIFDKLESGKDMELSEKEFTDFLKNVQMELNQIQLDQLYSHLYVNGDVEIGFIQFWRLKKTIDYMQFSKAIDYIMQQKVKMALRMLDVSHTSLCLSILQTLFQSVIIAWIIYSVFSGLSQSDSSFDFSANSIVSLGSVIGIILSKQDKGKVLEDEQLVQSTVDKVENQMHSND